MPMPRARGRSTPTWFAARPKDWLDVEGILQRQVLLDWSYIEQQLPPLLELKKEPENWKTLMKLKASAP